MKKFFLFAVFACLALCLCVSANGSKVSPAIDVIAYGNSMVKSGVIYDGEINFDKNDFDNSVGKEVKNITIRSLPNENKGKLMLANLYVVENQIIERDDFSLLKFVQASSEESTCSFSFEPNFSGYTIECEIKSIKSVNFSPVIAYVKEAQAWTQTNISCYNTLNAYDPEGDTLRFEIVSYPEKGLLKLVNSSTGDYKYTPYEDKKGTDSFSYRVRDSYGNYSDTYTVSVKIDKLKSSLIFADMNNSKSLNAALVLTNMEIMDYEVNLKGEVLFNPEEKITREEFVVLLMNTMGAKNVPTVEKTRFADDKDIKSEYKGYIESAFSLGIISGKSEKDGVRIYPKEEISTAEAATIINKIVGAKPQATSVFKDEEDIPAIAKDDIISLAELGIISKAEGMVNPNSTLTREQTAQILLSLLQNRGKLK